MSETNESVSQRQQDLVDQLLKPEVQESLTSLIEQLPKINELVNALTASYDFAHSVATDDVLKSDTVNAITEVLHPVTDSVKTVAQTAIEAKDRAESSNETIGLFGLLRLMKDPQAQKMFRFVQSYLEVANEKERQKQK
ncbi:DUF1641 domain-containing protein [Terribacillus sp. 7520-G]|uniref:DUF1641 domain-containing protein n=1 Tax=Terribacillus TaxID=459532 RepID=UPI000BA61E1E|nr:DUF1641 domain-containing protein [Terribacillus sp. 7520-G]PAD38298.1 hypothetical protein CHH53_11755 [Terribacillus sp. 7520-G]